MHQMPGGVLISGYSGVLGVWDVAARDVPPVGGLAQGPVALQTMPHHVVAPGDKGSHVR